MLADITNAVTSTLDSREALRRLARLVVPRLGDWCVVDLFTPPMIERVAVHHRDADRVPEGKYERLLPSLVEGCQSPLAWALRGAPASLLTDLASAVDPTTELGREQIQLFRDLDGDTAIIAPLRGRRGAVLGAVTVVRIDPDRPLGEADLAPVDDVARRAALAVENGQLYAAQRNIAETLQRSLLPRIPAIDHLQFASSYRPAAGEAEVGGDWYDVFLLPRGEASLIIGDVMGHDIDSAVQMGQVRNLLRALACDRDDGPAGVLQRLDQIVTHLQACAGATAVFGVIEGPLGGPWELRWSNAGHPAPLLVLQDGTTEILEREPDPMLALAPGTPRSEHRASLPPNSTVVLYTDGLVESRERPAEAGLALLAQRAGALADAPVAALVEDLAGSVETPDDDIAILAVRIPEAGAGAS